MANSKDQVYELQGLSCANCAAQFEKNVQNIPSVEGAQVNFAASKITVTGDVTVNELEKAGAFDHIQVRGKNDDTFEQVPLWKKRENISAAISLVILLIGISLQFSIGKEHPVVITTFIIAILVGGYDLFISGFKNLFRFYFDLHTLMTIAIIGAAFIGEWVEGAAVVILFAISEGLESYSVDKARQSIKSLVDIAPNHATIRRHNEVIEVHVDKIQINDIMLIKPGEKVAMDGEVISGNTSINQAAITGESIPVQKQAGDEVFAGTLNEEGSIEVRVTKLVDDTTIAKIIHLVEEAQAEKAPAQKFVDRFALYYTPAIMVIAFFVAVIPPLFLGADWSHWVYLGLATLVVGCPCALIISTPVAIVTAIGNAAKQGVLIKGGIHLEETGRLNIIAFDKTGTLTKGIPEVTHIVPLTTMEEEKVLQIARAIEEYSQHPIASAIIREANKRELSEKVATNFQSISGKGAQANVDKNLFYIGNASLFNNTPAFNTIPWGQMESLQQEGHTVMLLGTNEQIVALIAVADPIRETSYTVIDKLKNLGIKHTIMLSGDNHFTANAIAKKIGMTDVQGDLLPTEKLNVINELKEKHERVGMVGDGVNDAPALASATIGIAMGGAGTDAALETSDIALMDDNIDKLPYTIGLSKHTLKVIKQNIFFAFIIKIIALLLVIPGWLTLWIAVVADVGATLIVVLNSMRLMKFE